MQVVAETSQRSGADQEGHLLHLQDQETRHSEEAPQCTASAASCPGTTTLSFSLLEKPGLSPTPQQRTASGGSGPCCPHTQTNSGPASNTFVIPLPSGWAVAGVIHAPRLREGHTARQEGMSLCAHK